MRRSLAAGNAQWLQDRIKEVALDAFWRLHENRKSHWQALTCLPQRSPLLGVPFFHLDILQLDWLHIMDLGVQQFLGSTFKFLCSKLPGANLEAQCKELHVRMKFFYRVNETASKLDVLKPTMLQAAGKPYPKLRAKAAEARALVPFFPGVDKGSSQQWRCFWTYFEILCQGIEWNICPTFTWCVSPPKLSLAKLENLRFCMLLWQTMLKHKRNVWFILQANFICSWRWHPSWILGTHSDVWTYRDGMLWRRNFLIGHPGEVDPAILMQLACLFSKGLWPTTMSLACRRSVLLLLFLGWWFSFKELLCFRSSFLIFFFKNIKALINGFSTRKRKVFN